MKNKVIYRLCFIISCILSNIMCIVVTYKWVEHMQHTIYSAPAYVNIIYGIPYLIAIITLMIVGIIFYKKDNK